MDNYFVIKVCKQGVRIIAVDFTNRNKISIVGNLPELYHGITIKCNLEYSEELSEKATYPVYRCIDYVLDATEKNKKVLTRNGVDLERYGQALEIHSLLKDQGFTWKSAKVGAEEVYDSLPFEQADKLHKYYINDPTDQKRINAINKKVISMGRMKRKITYQIDEFLSMFDEIEKHGAYQKLMSAIKIMSLQADEYSLKHNLIFDNEMKEKEDYIKENIQQRLETEYELMKKYEIEKFIQQLREENYLSDEQLNVLLCLNNNLPCIVTGGAGTGKTSVVKAIIDCYTKFYSKRNVLLLAPTGKASRRLAEKTGFEASTIHKALRKCPDDNFIFYTEKNPLPHRLIVVDESSMIGTELMHDLLKAVDDSAKIIFVGDHNQLCPVEYGEPFIDFFDSLQVFALKENHRQEEGTDILKNANAILNDENIHSGRGIIVKHIDFMDIGDILDRERNNREVQFISPYNSLNKEINDYLMKNKNAPSSDDILNGEEYNDIEPAVKYATGDKVMTIKNTKKYCNGDIGYVTRVAQSGNVTVDIEGKGVCIKKAEINDLTFAYAITVHKMQGSEADKVIVFIPENDTLIDKHMMYTAITRARKEIEIYFYSHSA